MSDESVAVPAVEQLTCELCGVSLTEDTALAVSGHAACNQCVAQLQAELDSSKAGAGSLPLGLVGTLLGAGVGAAVWAGIAIGTDFEIGYVAVLVGFLAGKGATLLTGGGHGKPLQVLAVLGSVIGLVAAKYAIFAYSLREYVLEEYGETVGWFDASVLESFPDALREMTGGFDILWVILAVGAAWRVPASPVLHVEQP